MKKMKNLDACAWKPTKKYLRGSAGGWLAGRFPRTHDYIHEHISPPCLAHCPSTAPQSAQVRSKRVIRTGGNVSINTGLGHGKGKQRNLQDGHKHQALHALEGRRDDGARYVHGSYSVLPLL